MKPDRSYGCSVAKSCLTPTPWLAARQAFLSFTISWSFLRLMAMESVMPSDHLILCCPLFQHQGLFQWVGSFASGGQSIGATASVLPMSIQGWFPLELTGWSVCCPRDSRESSLAAHFKSINSLVLRLLYGPTLISIRDCELIALASVG